VSTEEQRAKWREKARERRDAKLLLDGPKPAKAKEGRPPSFLEVQTREAYVITCGDGTTLELDSDQLEELYVWWKAKRKSA